MSDKITVASRTFPSKTEALEIEKSIEIPRERYLSPEKTWQIIDELSLIKDINMWTEWHIKR